MALHFGTVNADVNAGINWDGSVTTTAGGAGQIAFIQLIKTHRTVTFPEGTYVKSSGDAYVLDANEDAAEVAYNPPKSIGSSETLPIEDRDSPGQRLVYQDAATIDDKFKMFLMYKPEGGIWVTLSHLDWWWKGEAVRDPNSPNGYSLVQDSPSIPPWNPSGSNSLLLPEWETRVKELEYEDP